MAIDPFEAIARHLPTFEDEAMPSLRQQAMRDPVAGAPLRVTPLPGTDPVDIEPGDWGPFADNFGLPPGCPVTPLGMDGMTAFFLSTMGAVVELDAKSSGKGPIGALFAGRSRYVEWAWPRFTRGKNPAVIGWEADDARQALFDAAAWRGFFAIEDQVRGRGCWRDADGSLIYHAGDAVWIAGKWKPPGAYGEYIYPARAKIGRPTGRAQPAGADGPGQLLLDVLRSFSWERGDFDALLCLGWVITAKLGGALDRRPVGFITGPEGSGKSTLHGVLRVAMNGALVATSNTTQAGIYQRLRHDSIAIMVDEMEAKEDTRVVDRILELARISYSGDKMQRGGKDGAGKEFSLFSSFLGSSIAKPATDAQDDSRMVVMNLRERPKGGTKLGVEPKQVAMMGADLLRRALDAWPHWDTTVEWFRARMIEAGHLDRAADTFAPLMAGAHIALSDVVLTEDMAPALARDAWERWAAFAAPQSLAETASRQASWQRCFWHMLSAQPDALRTYAHKSPGAAISAWRDTEARRATMDGETSLNPEDCHARLTSCGMALSWPKGAEKLFSLARLFVPHNSPGLHALFAGTQWQGRLGAPGPWSGVLAQMPRELFKVQSCDRLLNKSAKGLMIDLAAVLALFEGDDDD